MTRGIEATDVLKVSMGYDRQRRPVVEYQYLVVNIYLEVIL